jgi:phosphatidylinositol glycan class B
MQKEQTFLFTGLKIIGIILVFVTAFFSIGIHHYDEYFQIIEFANFKNGGVDASLLPWEFHAEMRPGIQPLIAFVVLKGLSFFNVSNPFVLMLILRLLTAVLTSFVSVKAFNFISPKLHSNVSRLLLILSLFLLWFMPYVMVRFSSEIIGGYVFVWAVLLILEAKEKSHSVKWIAAGVLIVIAFYVRYQLGAAIFGLIGWMIICKERVHLKALMWLFVGILFGGLISVLCDCWLYGEWVLSPLNYFSQNLIEGKAASFGVSPWWSYFRMFFKQMGVPLAILSFPLLIVGVVTGRKSVYLWIFLPFLILHLLVGHKELRFLFPMIVPFIVLMVLGLDFLMKKAQRPNIVKWGVVIVFLINVPALLFRVVHPADEKFKQISNLTQINKYGSLRVITINEDLFSYGPLKMHLMESNSMNNVHLSDLSELSKYIQEVGEGKATYLLVKGTETDLIELRKNYIESEVTSYKFDPPFDLYGWLKKNPHYYLFKVE